VAVVSAESNRDIAMESACFFACLFTDVGVASTG
jgi:hypothetical protein